MKKLYRHLENLGACRMGLRRLARAAVRSPQGYWNSWENASDMAWILGRLGYIRDNKEDYDWLVRMNQFYLAGATRLYDIRDGGHAGFTSRLKKVIEENFSLTQPEEWHIACFWADFFQGCKPRPDLCQEIRKRFPEVPKELV